MLLKKINIKSQLDRSRIKNVGHEQQVLLHVYQILEDLDKERERIKDNLSVSKKQCYNVFDFDLLDTSKIYHIADIKKVCIDYRLRFLDSRYFKGSYPESVFSEIRKLEEDHRTELQGFKIMAPSKLFKLEDKDDPLLFVPIGNSYFYLVHSWGHDLHPLRKFLMWPFKNIGNLIALVLAISLCITSMIPDGLFSKSNSTAEFWIIYFFMFKSVASVVLFYGFAMGKNFNYAIWNSKFFNA